MIAGTDLVSLICIQVVMAARSREEHCNNASQTVASGRHSPQHVTSFSLKFVGMGFGCADTQPD